MALTQSDLDRLNAAITSSELEVEFGDGRRVRYRSMSDLQAAYDHAVRVIAQQTAQSTGRRTGYFTFTTSRER